MAILNLGTVVPDSTGRCSSKFRDGNSGAGTPPSVPVLGQPVATSPTSVSIALQAPATGPSIPIVYRLERSLSEISGYAPIAESSSIFDPDGVYDDTLVADDETYFYRLKAVGADLLESAYSVVVSVTTPAIVGDVTPPSQPTGATLSVISGFSDRLRANWNLSTDNVAVLNYDITLGLGDGAGNPVGEGSVIATVSAPPFDIQGLESEQQYYIRVKARDTSGNTSSGTSRVFQTTPAEEEPPVGTIYFSDGFESGTIKPASSPHPGGWAQVDSGSDVTHTVHAGGAPGSTGFFRRDRLDARLPNGGSYRAEQHCRVANQAMGTILNAAGVFDNLNAPVYMGMSIRIPASFVVDALSQEVFHQWHFGQIGEGTGTHAGHYAFGIDEDEWSFEVHPGEGGVDLGGPGGSLGSWVGDVGVWVRWVERYVFHQTNGSIKYWKNPTSENNTPVLQRSGIRTYRTDGSFPKATTGIYKPKWRTANFPPNAASVTPRIIEIDRVIIASTFDLVK